MGTLYYIVNDTREEYIDSTCKKAELSLDKDVMRTLIDLLDGDWSGDRIIILSERQLTNRKNLKPIKAEKIE